MTDGEDNTRHDESKGTWWVVAQGMLFVLFLISAVSGSTVSGVPGLVYAQITGLVVSIVGAGISAWSLFEHRWRVSPFPRPEEGASLVASGPYRFVRHPMYSGIVVFTLGVGLAYANPAALFSCLTFLVFFVAKTGREEEMLVERLDGYRAYRSDVPWRLIPFVV